MKEIKTIETIKLYAGETEIEVSPYLTYAEIQAIADSVSKFESWSERQENLDILLLHFATNLTNEDLNEIGHIALLRSGLIDEVKQNVKNFDRIQEAIDYNESTQKALAKIVKEMPKMLEPLKDVANKYGKTSKK